MEVDAIKERRNIPISNGLSPTVIPVNTTSRYNGTNGMKLRITRRASSVAYDCAERVRLISQDFIAVLFRLAGDSLRLAHCCMAFDTGLRDQTDCSARRKASEQQQQD